MASEKLKKVTLTVNFEQSLVMASIGQRLSSELNSDPQAIMVEAVCRLFVDLVMRLSEQRPPEFRKNNDFISLKQVLQYCQAQPFFKANGSDQLVIEVIIDNQVHTSLEAIGFWYQKNSDQAFNAALRTALEFGRLYVALKDRGWQIGDPSQFKIQAPLPKAPSVEGQPAAAV